VDDYFFLNVLGMAFLFFVIHWNLAGDWNSTDVDVEWPLRVERSHDFGDYNSNAFVGAHGVHSRVSLYNIMIISSL
jgi:hypothetical protein